MIQHGFKFILLLVFVSTSINCKSDSYWSDACISKDEKTIAVAGWFYGAGLIDTQTGEILKSVDGTFDDVTCYENGDVAAFSSETNAWLNKDKEVKPGSVFNRDFRIGSDEYFYFRRAKKHVRPDGGDTDEKVQVNDGAPFLIIRKEGEPIKEENFIKLSPDRFEGVGDGDDSDFVVEPIKVSVGRKLLAAVGFPVYGLAHRQPASMIPENYWGVYEIDVENDAVKSAGQLKPINDKGLLFGLSNRLIMSEDEKLIAGVFDLTDGNSSARYYRSVVKVFEFPSMTEKFSTEFESECSADLKFSSDNLLLAVGSEKICWNLKDEMIQVFDLQKKQLLWQNILTGRPILLNFFKDDSMMVITSDLTAARYNAADGNLIWKKSF